jgi:hypothetical protein
MQCLNSSLLARNSLSNRLADDGAETERSVVPSREQAHRSASPQHSRMRVADERHYIAHHTTSDPREEPGALAAHAGILWPSQIASPRSPSEKILSVSQKVPALPFHRMGQQCWLEEHRRQSHVIRIGDRWPDTLATHPPASFKVACVQIRASTGCVRAPLDAVPLRKRNGKSRRGKPWRLLRVARMQGHGRNGNRAA